MIDLKSIVIEAFTDVYLNSTPSGNFEILRSFPGDWFLDFYISEELFEIIINRYIENYGLSGYMRDKFVSSMYLGPSPKFFPKNSSQWP